MEKLAIIGSGISGLGCVHLLDGRYQISLYEQDDHVGGHANTVEVDEDGRKLPVDTGFMVFNRVTYPNLCHLFERLGVVAMPTEMSFSVQHMPSGLEFAGSSVNHLFAQRRNLINPDFWRLLWEINRFNSESVAALENGDARGKSVEEFLLDGRYDADFRDRYLVPMSAAVWSTPPDRMLEFPAEALIRFFHNHGFLGLNTQHPWLTLKGGARTYVSKLLGKTGTTEKIRERVLKVVRHGRSVEVVTDGGSRSFDRVVMAAHADQSLAMLDRPDVLEEALLSKFRFLQNRATLHSDPSFMPQKKLAWSSWNYRLRVDRDGGLRPMTVYWMNRLQGVSDKQDYFVSINGENEIPKEHVVKSIDYEHPLFDLETIRAQERLQELNHREGDRRVFFCGAWFRYGFHEDGFASAIACSRALSDDVNWP
ncbi:MAG: FAD-dependent oxidoreductase [Verrucomicrobiae bacterium]|nr:FAD-dependent oxidoreductase [Verrucomicrobiae bacterium]